MKLRFSVVGTWNVKRRRIAGKTSSHFSILSPKCLFNVCLLTLSNRDISNRVGQIRSLENSSLLFIVHRPLSIVNYLARDLQVSKWYVISTVAQRREKSHPPRKCRNFKPRRFGEISPYGRKDAPDSSHFERCRSRGSDCLFAENVVYNGYSPCIYAHRLAGRGN